MRSNKQSATVISVTTECRRRLGLIPGAGESGTEAEEVAKKFFETTAWLFNRNGIEYNAPENLRED